MHSISTSKHYQDRIAGTACQYADTRRRIARLTITYSVTPAAWYQQTRHQNHTWRSRCHQNHCESHIPQQTMGGVRYPDVNFGRRKRPSALRHFRRLEGRGSGKLLRVIEGREVVEGLRDSKVLQQRVRYPRYVNLGTRSRCMSHGWFRRAYYLVSRPNPR
eukprot:2485850-Rhodomonas_salina.1